MKYEVIIRKRRRYVDGGHCLYGQPLNEIDSIERFCEKNVALARARELRDGRHDLAISVRRVGQIIPFARPES